MNPNSITLRGLVVWLICALYFMYEFLLRTVLGTFQHPIMDDLRLSPLKFAFLSSVAYQVIYGIMQLPVGVITDRFGLKKTLFSAVMICSAANMGFALAHQYDIAFLFRLLMGLGSAFGFVCLLVAVYDWMPRKNIALFIGLSQFIGTLGPMLAAGPLNTVAEAHLIGWRGFFMSLTMTALVLAVLIFALVENKRETTGKFLILNYGTSIKTNLVRLIRQPEIWYIAFFSACIYFAIEYLSENEGTAFLIRKGFSSTSASYMITIAWLGYAVGCPFLGYISDKLEKRKPIMIGSALAMSLGLMGIIYFDLNRFHTTACFLLAGVGASGQSIGFAIISEYCKESYLAIGLAFNNAMIMFCSAINAPLVGYLLSTSTTPAGSYSLTIYREAFTIMMVLAMLALLLSTFLIRETYCKSMRENTILNPTGMSPCR